MVLGKFKEKASVFFIKILKKLFRLILPVCFFILAVAVCNYLFFISYRSTEYNKAIELQQKRYFYDAACIFADLKDYKDSADRLFFCNRKLYGPDISRKDLKYDIGSIYIFGKYKNEPIPWIVVEKRRFSSMLNYVLVSQYGIDIKPYNNEIKRITWKDCSLRKWLNESFYKYAFDDYERSLIQEVNVFTYDDLECSNGVATTEKIFLLSFDELDTFFPSKRKKKCRPSVYAKAQGAIVKGGCSRYWLRSPGSDELTANTITGSGAFDQSTGINEKCAVRPVLFMLLQ